VAGLGQELSVRMGLTFFVNISNGMTSLSGSGRLEGTGHYSRKESFEGLVYCQTSRTDYGSTWDSADFEDRRYSPSSQQSEL
jgi:hypothetical protein